MKPSRFSVLFATLTLALPSSVVFGQAFPQQQGFPQQAAQDLPYDAQGQFPQALPQQQLENLVAPIALYPDALLSQILVAATYPLEVVEVGQWLQQNRNLQGQNLVAAASQQNWDASIQALVAFPDVVNRLNSDIRWTTDLGNAFLAQQGDVMNAIQVLRAQASANGRLSTNQQQIVTTEAQGPQSVIEIQPANPQVVYVPSYNPEYVWGPPAYGYYPSLYYPEFGFSYGYGIPIGGYFGGLGWNSWGWGPNWFGGGIVVNSYFFDRYHFNSYRGGRYGGGYGGGNNWAHNPDHRRGVSYSNNRVANTFRGTTRGDYRGGDTRFSGGQSSGQRFSNQSSSRGANQFNASRSPLAPSPSSPSQGTRFGNRGQGSDVNAGRTRGAQSFQAPAQSRQPQSFNNGGGGGGFRSNARSAPSAPSFQAPAQSRPQQSFNGGGNGGGGFRSNARSAPSAPSFQAPAQSRPPQSFNNGGGGGGFRSNARSAPSAPSFQAPAQSRPQQSFGGGGGNGGGSRGNGNGNGNGNHGGGQRGGGDSRSSHR